MSNGPASPISESVPRDMCPSMKAHSACCATFYAISCASESIIHRCTQWMSQHAPMNQSRTSDASVKKEKICGSLPLPYQCHCTLRETCVFLTLLGIFFGNSYNWENSLVRSSNTILVDIGMAHEPSLKTLHQHGNGKLGVGFWDHRQASTMVCSQAHL